MGEDHASRTDEIGQVAAHLDDLLDQVQERDERLRAWAEDLKQRVEERTSELREANEKIEHTYQQLVMSEKLASIGEITAGVAHEINNPVAVIQGNMDVIRETLGKDAEPLMTELILVDQQIMRINTIVGKLLKFARPSEFNDCKTAVSLDSVVDDCLVLVEHVLSRGNIEVARTYEDAPLVWADAGELQQVVINLIVNATQAINGAGQLTLHVSKQERDGVSGACLSVKDTGAGIPLERKEAVFDPFFTTKRGEGTGLGLSISQSLILRAGGRITVHSPDEGGTEFRVWLPQMGDI